MSELETVILLIGSLIIGTVLIIFRKEYQNIMCKLGRHKKKVKSMGTWLCENENCQKTGIRVQDKKTGRWTNK